MTTNDYITEVRAARERLCHAVSANPNGVPSEASGAEFEATLRLLALFRTAATPEALRVGQRQIDEAPESVLMRWRYLNMLIMGTLGDCGDDLSFADVLTDLHDSWMDWHQNDGGCPDWPLDVFDAMADALGRCGMANIYTTQLATSDSDELRAAALCHGLGLKANGKTRPPQQWWLDVEAITDRIGTAEWLSGAIYEMSHADGIGWAPKQVRLLRAMHKRMR